MLPVLETCVLWKQLGEGMFPKEIWVRSTDRSCQVNSRQEGNTLARRSGGPKTLMLECREGCSVVSVWCRDMVSEVREVLNGGKWGWEVRLRLDAQRAWYVATLADPPEQWALSSMFFTFAFEVVQSHSLHILLPFLFKRVQKPQVLWSAEALVRQDRRIGLSASPYRRNHI